ncbi:MAG: hypothetical protein MI974_04675 [Chitinophagales bacterium]|nr:hypothetical protein [Chitinophagales bacterium]
MDWLKFSYKYLLIIPLLLVLQVIGFINIESTRVDISITATVRGKAIQKELSEDVYFYWGWKNKRLKDNRWNDTAQFIIESVYDQSHYPFWGAKNIDVNLIGFKKVGSQLLPGTINIKGDIKGWCTPQGAHEYIQEQIRDLVYGDLFS